MSHLTGSSLTETLVLALTQCQEQLRVIQQHSSRIDQLQRENERLAKEIHDYRDATVRNAQKDVDQTQELFQKYAEAQAEIQVLKSKLRSYKAKTSRRLTLSSSSPVITPATPIHSSPKQSSAKRKTVETLPPPMRNLHEIEANGENALIQGRDSASDSPPRKRVRPDDPETAIALQEVAANLVPSSTPFVNAPKSDFMDRKIAAISHLAEDGDEHGMADEDKGTSEITADQSDPVYHRLDGLLAGSVPNKNRLAKPASRSPRSADSPSEPRPRALPGISNIRHTLSENQNRSPDLADRHGAIPELETATPKSPLYVPQIPSKDRTPASMNKRSGNATKSVEPLRARPLSELRLSSFKPNPRWLSSHNISFDDFLNDRQYERMRTLATTLPHLPGESYDHHFTEHELLVDFIGPGSEARIANLTPVARQNLLIEARTKRVANGFRLSKQTAARNDDHRDDPPGFWSTDMPGTQEAEENKIVSRQKEQEEVRRRHDDAIGGQGRWVFADE